MRKADRCRRERINCSRTEIKVIPIPGRGGFAILHRRLKRRAGWRHETYSKEMRESAIAVFGDVHSNLEALQAVMADMDAMGVSRRVCLGDIVGYGANPSECVEMVRSMGCRVVKGNHDAFSAGEESLGPMNDVARRGIEFARGKLTPQQRQYLFALPLTVTVDECQFVHASLDAPGEWIYVMRESDARDHFRFQKHGICFCGHTHVPQVWHRESGGEIVSWRGQGWIDLPGGGRTLVNAGSVGQPRDRCPDACYVVFEPQAQRVEFRRVPYDIRKTGRKIVRAGLPRFAAQRLSLGR